MVFLLISYLRYYIQPDDGYICRVETCSCVYVCDKSCV